MITQNSYVGKYSGHTLCKALLGSITIVWLSVLSPAVFAATSCSVASVSSVSFGPYNVFATTPNNNGIGSLTLHCQGGGGKETFDVTLSTGQSNSYALRMMMSGGDLLNYNLYTSATRTRVWGDGTGISSVMMAGRNTTTTLNLFGKIPAGQDVAVGTYADNITATVNF